MLARLAATLLDQSGESISVDKSWLGSLARRSRGKLAKTLAFISGTVETLLCIIGFNVYKTSTKLVI